MRGQHDDLAIERAGVHRRVQERVGLVLGNQTVELPGQLDLTLAVVLAAQALDDAVGGGIVVADEVELVAPGLARVPDLIEIRVDAHQPAEDDRVETAGIDEVLEKHRPLEHLGVDLDADALPAVLSDGKYCLSDQVSVVGDEIELEDLAVFLQPALGVLTPAEILENSERTFRVVGQRRNGVVVPVGLLGVGAGGALALAVHDVANDLVHVDGHA